MIATFELISVDARATLEIGRSLGERLIARDVVALSGPLGAGKTQLTKGIALGLGVAQDEPVASPTFVLVREYAGRLLLRHADAYRISGLDEFHALGLDDADVDDRVTVVEWAERVAAWFPQSALWIELAYDAAPARRRITIRADESRIQSLAAALAASRVDILARSGESTAGSGRASLD